MDVSKLATEYLKYCKDWSESPTKDTWDKHRYWKYILLDIINAMENKEDAKTFNQYAITLCNGLTESIDRQVDEYLQECCRILQRDPKARLPDPAVIDDSELD